MSIVGACMVPHPPIILPEVGRGEEKKIAATYRAYERAAEFVAETKPETIIVTSPHVILYSDWFHISPGKRASGDMRRFGAPGTKLQVTYDTELRDVICRNAHAMDFPAGTLGEREAQLDHATFIPLWFINKKYTDYKLIRIGLSGFSLSEHYRLGQLIQKSIDETGRRVFFVGSGDLSHKLLAEGPYGLDENGPVYDERIMRDMGAADFGALLDYPPEFLDRAAECGHRSFCIMAGALDGLRVRPEMLSHEGTFGVGYGIVLYHMEDSADDAGSIGSAATGSGNAGVSAGKQGISGGCDLARKFLDCWFEKKNAELAKARAAEDPWVRLARATVERYVRDQHHARAGGGTAGGAGDQCGPGSIVRDAGTAGGNVCVDPQGRTAARVHRHHRGDEEEYSAGDHRERCQRGHPGSAVHPDPAGGAAASGDYGGCPRGCGGNLRAGRAGCEALRRHRGEGRPAGPAAAES